MKTISAILLASTVALAGAARADNAFTVSPEEWAVASAAYDAQPAAKVPVIDPSPRLPSVHRLLPGETASSDTYNWICTIPSDVDQAFALWRGGQTVDEVEATVDCVKLPAGEKAIAMDEIDGVGIGSVDLVKVKLLGTYKNTVGWASAIGWVQ
jgi:hypothetical protein